MQGMVQSFQFIGAGTTSILRPSPRRMTAGPSCALTLVSRSPAPWFSAPPRRLLLLLLLRHHHHLHHLYRFGLPLCLLPFFQNLPCVPTPKPNTTTRHSSYAHDSSMDSTSTVPRWSTGVPEQQSFTCDSQHHRMAFWGSSLPSGKEVSVGEEETEVTITMGSIRNAEKLKNGARVCLLCAPPG
jgi:hypothetical protein